MAGAIDFQYEVEGLYWSSFRYMGFINNPNPTRVELQACRISIGASVDIIEY